MDDTYRPPANGWRTFLIVWATQSLSVLGSALTFFAINVWLTQTLYARPEQKPELAAALAACSLAYGIPVIFGAPLAGAWADRHDRRRTMLAMDFGSGLVTLALAILVADKLLQLWLLVALLALGSVLAAFHGSAFDTSYAMLVPKERLPRANGMMQTIWALSGVVAPALAALLIGLPALARQGVLAGGPLGAALARLADGTSLAMTADALTFFIAAATLIFLAIPSPKRSDLTTVDAGGRTRKKSIWADVRTGALYIWHRKPLLWLLATFTAWNFFSAPVQVLLPLLVKFNLAADWTGHGFTYETALAALNTAFAIGGVAGGIGISIWGGLRRRRVYAVVAGGLVSGLGMVVAGLSPWLYLTIGAGIIAASVGPVANAHSQAIWQTQTPHEMQGRVFAVRRLIAQFSAPLGTALAGWAGGLFNAGSVIAVLGAVLLLFLIAQLFNPFLLQVEDKAGLDRMAALAEESAG